MQMCRYTEGRQANRYNQRCFTMQKPTHTHTHTKNRQRAWQLARKQGVSYQGSVLYCTETLTSASSFRSRRRVLWLIPFVLLFVFLPQQLYFAFSPSKWLKCGHPERRPSIKTTHIMFIMCIILTEGQFFLDQITNQMRMFKHKWHQVWLYLLIFSLMFPVCSLFHVFSDLTTMQRRSVRQAVLLSHARGH